MEKLNTVKVNVPGAVAGQSDQMDLQIPQLVSWRLHERFRWPNDQVLLLSSGVVAKPEPQAPRSGPIPNVFANKRNRADALLFIEYRGPVESGVGAASSLSTVLPTPSASSGSAGFRQATLPTNEYPTPNTSVNR